jgi:L-cystine uptake protein TcyP (sodium:dicarboxylate symporter family)
MLLFLSFLIMIVLIGGLFYLQRKECAYSRRVVIGLVLGIVFGLIFNSILSEGNAKVFSDWVSVLGSVYVKLLQMIAIPLVLICVLLAFTKVEIKSNVLKIGGTIVVTLIVFAGIAGLIGLLTGHFMGVDGNAFTITETAKSTASELQKSYVSGDTAMTMPQKIIAIFPSNFFSDLTGGRAGATLGVVIVSLFLGVGYLRVKSEKPDMANIFQKGIDSIYYIVMTVVYMLLGFAPYAVFTIMTTTIVNSDGGAIVKLAQFFIACYIGILIVFILQIITLMICGISPVKYIKAAFPVLSFAFITASSAGAMPMNIEMQEKKLGIPTGISGLSAPFATSMGMVGCAGVYPGVIIAIIAATQGINVLSPGFLFGAAGIIALTSFGIAGTGGGGTVASIISLSALGLPVGLVGVFIAVEPLIDMGRTVINLQGGIVASAITCKFNKIPYQEVYNEELDKSNLKTSHA